MTLADALTIFGPYIVAGLALLGTAYTIRSQRGKSKGDASLSMASASSLTIDDLMQQITVLNVRTASMLLTAADSKTAAKRSLELVARLLQGINVLLTQVRMAGLSPDWIPDPEIERLVALCTEESDRLAIPKIVLNKDSGTNP
jgi:hypothetical protein